MSRDTGHQLRNNTEFIAVLSVTLRHPFALVYCRDALLIETFSQRKTMPEIQAAAAALSRLYRYRYCTFATDIKRVVLRIENKSQKKCWLMISPWNRIFSETSETSQMRCNSLSTSMKLCPNSNERDSFALKKRAVPARKWKMWKTQRSVEIDWTYSWNQLRRITI